MNRIMDVSSILSKRSDLPPGTTTKPDVPLQEQRVEATLLKERWLMTQQDVDKKT